MNSPISDHPIYRAYIISPGGGILLAHNLNCGTDEQAIRKAREYTDGHAVELWDRSRKIASFPPNRRSE